MAAAAAATGDEAAMAAAAKAVPVQDYMGLARREAMDIQPFMMDLGVKMVSLNSTTPNDAIVGDHQIQGGGS